MTAKNLLSPYISPLEFTASDTVDAHTHVLSVLHLLIESEDAHLRVIENNQCIGIIDKDSLLIGLHHFIADRDDSSVITFQCSPDNFSASYIAHAVEDADAHLVDLFSTPTENGFINVTLRVRHTDPTAVIQSLERYGFKTTDSFSSESIKQNLVALERLQALQAILNV